MGTELPPTEAPQEPSPAPAAPQAQEPSPVAPAVPDAQEPSPAAPAVPKAEEPISSVAAPQAQEPNAAAPVLPQDMDDELLQLSSETITDEPDAVETFDRMKKLVLIQSTILGVVGLLLVLFLPFTRTVHLYYALDPARQVAALVGLKAPNMTNRAVLAWATTSITEVLTMGFGDFEETLPKQKSKFTERGWVQFVKNFKAMDIGKTFRQSQLVLTSVPSNTPVIVRQGINDDDLYQWDVQMPIIMTYATNNNVMRRESHVVTLTIVRVPTTDNPFGISIRNWAID